MTHSQGGADSPERVTRPPLGGEPAIGGTGGIRTPEACARPLSRRLHSSALPPFRTRGYRRYTPGLPGEVPERPNGAPC